MKTVVYDLEFYAVGRHLDLISVGMVDQDGSEYYAVSESVVTDRNLGVRILRHPWLMANVMPWLPGFDPGMSMREFMRFDGPPLIDPTDECVKPRDVIAAEVAEFLRDPVDEEPAELWAWYGGCGFDHVALTQLYPSLKDRPPSMPMRTRDLVDLWIAAGRPPKPPDRDVCHHAVEDCHWGWEVYRACAPGNPLLTVES